MTKEELTSTLNKWSTDELLNILPAEITYKNKKWYKIHEVYDLAIRKGRVFNTWTVEYFNDRSVKTYFQVQKKDLRQAIIEIVIWLVKEGFVDAG